jgi:hypothetical protein
MNRLLPADEVAARLGVPKTWSRAVFARTRATSPRVAVGTMDVAA